MPSQNIIDIGNAMLENLRRNRGQANKQIMVRGVAKAIGFGRLPDQGMIDEAIQHLIHTGCIKKVRSGKGDSYMLIGEEVRDRIIKSSTGPYTVSFNPDNRTVSIGLQGDFYPVMTDHKGAYIQLEGRKVYIKTEDGSTVLEFLGELMIQGEGPLGDFAVVTNGLRILF